MNVDWSPLRIELAVWQRDQRELPLWWRDDDAIEDTPDLRKLLSVSEKIGLPVHLAVIPKFATDGLVQLCKATPDVVPLVHGWAHQNHAPDGAKKAEFGHPRPAATAEARDGLERLFTLFGTQLLPMFVPPWNRIDASITATLRDSGYVALSTYTPRPAVQRAGLAVINTHVDPIHWKAGGGLVDPAQIIAELVTLLQDRRRGITDASEPLGFLTHHLVHDAPIWAFSEALLSELLAGGATPCNLRDMQTLYAGGDDSVSELT